MWKFFRHRDGPPMIDPIEAEFFTDEEYERTARHLIRESIQNSLDATKVGKMATVQFTFGQMTATADEFLTRDLRRHLDASRRGLRYQSEITRGGRFLAVEDYGTYGLTGDINRMTDLSEGNNASDIEDRFYYFWRNVGRNEKAEGSRGTWGLGKTVFPASSRINAFFGLTCRDGDDRPLLLGRSTLKSHLLDGVQYDPYGYFARWQDEMPLPIDEERVVSRFKNAFNITRSSDEMGLSIVIPHVIDTFNESMMTSEIIEHYFYPILKGDLTVRIRQDCDPPSERILDRDELLRVCQSGELRSKDPDLADTMDLAAWATSRPRLADAMVRPPSKGSRSDWANADWINGDPTALREIVNRGEAFTVDLWVSVESKESTRPVMSTARLYGMQVGRGRHKRKSYFTRRGINIVDACKDNPDGFVFLIEIEDHNLAGMVGSAENPSHTNLTSRDKLRDLYGRRSGALIKFLRLSPNGIAYAIEDDDREPDKTLLADIFWRPIPKADNNGKRKVKPNRGGEQTAPPVIDPPNNRKPPMLRVNSVASGFTVGRNPDRDDTPIEVSIKVAYARSESAGRRTQALKVHHRLDFDFNELERSGLSVTTEGCKYEVRGPNEFRVTDIDVGFHFRIEGFDTGHRDLVVDARHVPQRSTS